jgi:GT2 family glycosyltransferase
LEEKTNITSSPSVLIIVLNWMKYDDTINCVNSLLKLDYPNFKILVVDNNSLNNSVSALKKRFPDTLIIKSPENNGYAAGNKIGADYAIQNKYDLVWILNNDCFVRNDSLIELVNAYKRNPNAIFSNLTLMSENPDIIHYAGTYEIDESLQPDKYPTYDKLKGKPLVDFKDTLTEKPARIYGHSMLIPTHIINKYGFMDTRYFMFYEETDYCLSLYKKGIPSVFVPKAIITHISTSTYSLSPKMKYIGRYYSNRNLIFYNKKYGKVDYKNSIAKRGGFLGIIKYFVKYLLSPSFIKDEDYYINLGFLHGLLNIRGKYIKPEEFLN